jgi:hypothetical protein
MSTAAETTRPALAELTDEAIVAWARRTRARKGLPPKVEDAATLHRIIVLAFSTRPLSNSTDQQGGASPA